MKTENKYTHKGTAAICPDGRILDTGYGRAEELNALLARAEKAEAESTHWQSEAIAYSNIAMVAEGKVIEAGYDNRSGMTLRDHFAGLAMQGLVSRPVPFSQTAEEAFKQADAMLAAREAQAAKTEAAPTHAPRRIKGGLCFSC